MATAAALYGSNARVARTFPLTKHQPSHDEVKTLFFLSVKALSWYCTEMAKHIPIYLIVKYIPMCLLIHYWSTVAVLVERGKSFKGFIFCRCCIPHTSITRVSSYFFERCRFFQSSLCTITMFFCVEGTSHVFLFRRVFFYLVTIGWIFLLSAYVRIQLINESRYRCRPMLRSVFPYSHFTFSILGRVKRILP